MLPNILVYCSISCCFFPFKVILHSLKFSLSIETLHKVQHTHTLNRKQNEWRGERIRERERYLRARSCRVPSPLLDKMPLVTLPHPLVSTNPRCYLYKCFVKQVEASLNFLSPFLTLAHTLGGRIKILALWI